MPRTWSNGTSPPIRINQKWYDDGTDLTGEGKLHLASVLDMGSRRVLGFALSEHHNAELAYGALAMAVAVRGGQVPGVMIEAWHSTLTFELRSRETFATKATARARVPAGSTTTTDIGGTEPAEAGHRWSSRPCTSQTTSSAWSRSQQRQTEAEVHDESNDASAQHARHRPPPTQQTPQ